MALCSTQANATIINFNYDFKFDTINTPLSGQFTGNDINSNGILSLMS